MKLKDAKSGELARILGYAYSSVLDRTMNVHGIRCLISEVRKSGFCLVSVEGINGLLKVHVSQLRPFPEPAKKPRVERHIHLVELKQGESIVSSSLIPTPNEGILDKNKVYNTLSHIFTQSEFDIWWKKQNRLRSISG